MPEKNNYFDEIAKVAYELFENSGRMYGCELENWLAAEKIVMERHSREREEDANSTGSTKKKASGKPEPKTLKKTKKTSGSSSQANKKKSPPKKKTG